MSVTLILGGARSGKSRHAEGLAIAQPGVRYYLATAEPFDDEMRARIAQHRVQRGEGWETIEAPLELAAALAALHSGTVLIDCITVWIGNLMHAGRNIEPEVSGLVQALAASPCGIVVVSNEVGLSVVPDNTMARRFRDAQGRANQALAAMADEVVFVAAGLPLVLKAKPR